MSGYLSKRPVGVRKSFKRSICTSDDREYVFELIGQNRIPSWAKDTFEPSPAQVIEAHYFKDRRGSIRRVEIAFSNGRMISLRRNKSGSVIVYKWLPPAALELLKCTPLEQTA